MRSDIRNRESQNAWKMANEVHGNQLDKGGEPYMSHVTRVANEAVKGIPYGTLLHEQLWLVAILHDVVEDSEDHEDVKRRLQKEQTVTTVAAVAAITHDHWHSEPYLDYLKRVKDNDLAIAVKIADIQDNVDPQRMLKVLRNGTKPDFHRLTTVLTARYILALDYLNA